MNCYSYFPSLVYRDEKPEWLYPLKKYVSEYSGEVSEQNSFFQTADISESPELNDFARYILEESNKILCEQGYDVDRYNLKVNIWAQDAYRGSSTNIHVHKNSFLCGWMFLDRPEKGSYPIYYDPRVRKSMSSPDSFVSESLTESSETCHFNNVGPGTVLISSSWLEHSLSVNNDDLPTTCLHFIVSGEYK